mmetsp:Transcript_13240/g.34727  ORF Transcript_13240/g.34727 Transcript_13240/m.34727 type:complete len:90 (-) Transcript_13240:37-306(-)
MLVWHDVARSGGMVGVKKTSAISRKGAEKKKGCSSVSTKKKEQLSTLIVQAWCSYKLKRGPLLISFFFLPSSFSSFFFTLFSLYFYSHC